MRGASALQSVLEKARGAPVRVFIVWESILSSDLGAPITFVLRRTPDLRVQQYWDPDHLVARRMASDARAPQPEPECCDDDGVLWDLAAVYPKGSRWDDRIPSATVFNGPVVDITDSIERAIGR